GARKQGRETIVRNGCSNAILAPILGAACFIPRSGGVASLNPRLLSGIPPGWPHPPHRPQEKRRVMRLYLSTLIIQYLHGCQNHGFKHYFLIHGVDASTLGAEFLAPPPGAEINAYINRRSAHRSDLRLLSGNPSG